MMHSYCSVCERLMDHCPHLVAGTPEEELRAIADGPDCAVVNAADLAYREIVAAEPQVAELWLPTWCLPEWEARDRSMPLADQVRLLGNLRGRYLASAPPGEMSEAIAEDRAAMMWVAHMLDGGPETEDPSAAIQGEITAEIERIEAEVGRGNGRLQEKYGPAVSTVVEHVLTISKLVRFQQPKETLALLKSL